MDELLISDNHKHEEPKVALIVLGLAILGSIAYFFFVPQAVDYPQAISHHASAQQSVR